MTQTIKAHQVDVSIRSRVLDAAQLRLKRVQEQERARDGVAHTTMADVARAILANWKPSQTAPTVDEEGLRHDPTGTRITTRGHRKFKRPERATVPARPEGQNDLMRAAALRDVLDKAVEDNSAKAVAMVNEVKRVMHKERLGALTLDGVTLEKWWTRARRQLLPPLRFTMAEDKYQQIYARLTTHDTTLTRALEVGLERFAKTGKVEEDPKHA